MNNHLKNQFIRWYFNEFNQDPLFLRMAETVENSPYHREDNVAIHTNMVVAEYIGLAALDWDHYTLLGAIACAFHDTGKPIAAKKNGIKFKPERGNYLSFGGHEQISARMWEDYAARNWAHLADIFGLSAVEIYNVGWMIEYHLPWGVKKTDKLDQMASTSMVAVDPEVFTNVMKADTLGRISDDYIEKRQTVSDWIDKFHQEIIPRQCIGDCEPASDQPVLVMPIGASGTGKSTYRNSLDDFEMYSWDDLRLEFYSSDYEEAFRMSVDDKQFGNRVNARFMELVKAGKNIYVDNVNVSKKRRAFFLREARRKGYFLRAALFPIELDILIARQETRDDKTVPEGIVKSQYRAIQLPQSGEFDDVVVMSSNLPDIA